MAIKFYRDALCTDEIPADQSDPDLVHEAVAVGAALVDDAALYLKSDDALLTYESIVLTASGDDVNCNVLYALDVGGNPGEWGESITIPNGAFAAAVKVHRRVSIPAVNAPFNRVDITHALSYHSFAV